MGADGAPHASALRGIAPPVPLSLPIPAVRTRIAHFGKADRADLADAFPRGTKRGEESQLMIDERDAIAMRAPGSDKFLRLCSIDRRRLFADHMLPGAERGEGNLHVRRGRRDDGDQVGIAIDRAPPGMATEELDLEPCLAEIRGLRAFGPAASDDPDSSHGNLLSECSLRL